MDLGVVDIAIVGRDEATQCRVRHLKSSSHPEEPEVRLTQCSMDTPSGCHRTYQPPVLIQQLGLRRVRLTLCCDPRLVRGAHAGSHTRRWPCFVRESAFKTRFAAFK